MHPAMSFTFGLVKSLKLCNFSSQLFENIALDLNIELRLHNLVDLPLDRSRACR